VTNAMKEGTTPAQIIVEGLQLEGVNPIQLIQALYGAGASGADIGLAALDVGVSELALSAGYENSIAECKTAISYPQAYTPFASAFTHYFCKACR